MGEDLVIYEPNQISTDVKDFSNGLAHYLNYLGLPAADDVLVKVDERSIVIVNMPLLVQRLCDEHKESAYYLSKFIASCGVGLFDAALSYLWNETIVNLRQKITRFDLDYFYDSVISSSERRSEFKNEADLSKLDDWQLIKGCLDTGIISDIGYKHLSHIKDMRNYASAAHPNHNQITGFEIIGWLDSCIKHVLAKDPSGPVLEVQKLLKSIRTEKLTAADAKPIISNIKLLPRELIHSLQNAIFGMYNDEKVESSVKDNIQLLARDIWRYADRESKYQTGLKYARFSANGEIARKNLAQEFLRLVDGLGFIPKDQLAIEIKECLDQLYAAHHGMNNFYTEKPYAINLSKFIPETGFIPEQIRFDYVKILLICQIGNKWGVSYAAKPYYDEMTSKFTDSEIKEFISLVDDSEIQVILTDPRRTETFRQMAFQFEMKTKDEVLKQALHIISQSSQELFDSKATAINVRKLFV